MFCSAALERLAVRVASVGSGVVGLILLAAAPSWAEAPEPNSGQLAQHASKSALVLGIPVSTAAWALLGLALIGVAMMKTSHSRNRVLAGLQAQTVVQHPAIPAVGERPSRGATMTAAYVDIHLEAGRPMPAVS